MSDELVSDITQQNKIPMTIHKDYCIKWTVRDALRELISNGLDTKTEISIKKRENFFSIEDMSTGIKTKHLLMGLSKERDIGQFGEGLKVGILVLLRNNRNVIVETVGRTYYPKLEPVKEFDNEKIMIWYWKNNSNKIGTKILVEISNEELEEAKKLFTIFYKPNVLDENDNGRIYENPDKIGKIYLKGVVVYELDSLFSYEITDKELVNRDRKAVNEKQLKLAVKKIIANTHNKKFIEAYYKKMTEENKDYFEYNMTFTPKKQEVWNEVFSNLFPKTVIRTRDDLSSDTFMKEEGYNIISVDSKIQKTLENIGISKTKDMAFEIKLEKIKRTEAIPLSKLTKEERQIFEKAVANAKDLFEKSIGKVNVLQEDEIFWNEDGHYDKIKDEIFIKRSVLNSKEKATGTIIHECVHKFYGFDDLTREFETGLSDACGKAAS